jgi:hypothetical protein
LLRTHTARAQQPDESLAATANLGVESSRERKREKVNVGAELEQIQSVKGMANQVGEEEGAKNLAKH